LLFVVAVVFVFAFVFVLLAHPYAYYCKHADLTGRWRESCSSLSSESLAAGRRIVGDALLRDRGLGLGFRSAV